MKLCDVLRLVQKSDKEIIVFNYNETKGEEMKFWEAMKLLQEGKKVRCKSWGELVYMYFNKDISYICLNSNGNILTKSSINDYELNGEWEEYIEEIDLKFDYDNNDIVYIRNDFEKYHIKEVRKYLDKGLSIINSYKNVKAERGMDFLLLTIMGKKV